MVSYRTAKELDWISCHSFAFKNGATWGLLSFLFLVPFSFFLNKVFTIFILLGKQVHGWRTQ